MSRALRHAFSCAALIGAGLLSTHCGGADIGEDCEGVGSTDDCVGGAVCTNEEGEALRCREICDDDVDCPDAHSCNGVSGTSTKSCQPD